MKYLEDLPNEWPWNPTNNLDMSDKKIYRDYVEEEDKSKNWRIPIYAPSDGFAYVGMRIHTKGKSSDYACQAKLRFGYTHLSVFGDKWDVINLKNDEWTPLGYPLTNHILAITEDSMDMVIEHDDEEEGYVEFLAQRLGDFQEENNRDIFYAFQNQDTLGIEWILYPMGHFVRPVLVSEYLTHVKVKIIPSLYRVLDPTMPPWSDRSLYYSAPLSSCTSGALN